MRRKLLPRLAGIALVAGSGLGAAFADRGRDPCSVILVAHGRNPLILRPTGSGFTAEFRSNPVRFDAPLHTGGAADCDRPMGAITERYAPGATSILKLVGADMYHAGNGVWRVATRPQLQYPWRDLRDLSVGAMNEFWVFSFEGALTDAAWAVASQHRAETDALTAAGAAAVADLVVVQALQGYVGGAELATLRDAVVASAVAAVQGRVALVKDTRLRGAALRVAILPRVDAILADVGASVIGAHPVAQTVQYEAAVRDECTHLLDLSWTFKGGVSRAALTVRCGEPEDEPDEPTPPAPPRPPPVASPVLTLVAPTLKPGEAGTVTVRAAMAGPPPAAVALATATVTGIAPVAPDGSPEPVAALAGNTAAFDFAAARPRRDAAYPVRVQVRTDDASGRLTEVATGTITVDNVGPTIPVITPGSATARPGELLTLDGAVVTVDDDNADRSNAGEVMVGSLALAHPDGLRTAPQFDRADNPIRLSHDPASGRYQFRFSRSGRVEDPHPHGTWAATVTMADDNGVRATSTVALMVEDVPPEVVSVVVTPGSVHRGQGALIQVALRVRDRNEAADIVGVSVDARDAGGAIYTLGQGLIETGRGPDWIALQLAQPFRQTDVPGPHPIPVTVSDERHAGTGGGSLFVGNTAPQTFGHGYITGFDPVTERAAQSAFAPTRGLCPNEPFRAGVIAGDPEGDALAIAATIVETGATATLRNTGGRIWVVDMRAPGTPGQYTIRLDVNEVPADLATSLTMPLEVVRCDGQQDQRRIASADPVTPTDVARAPRDDASQLLVGSFAGATVGAAAGTDPGGEGGPRVGALEDSLATLLAGLDGGHAAEVETYLVATGGSTGPVVQFYGLNRSGAPVRMPTGAVVFEPVRIDRPTQQRIAALLGQLVAAGAGPQVLNAYCLELLRKPPAAGTVLRVAAAPVQQALGPLQQIFDASDRLATLGRFRPDSDPEGYLHALRQWAIWTHRERLDVGGFEREFVRVTRDNVVQAGEAWTADVELAVRGLVPNRWNDIQQVLTELGQGAPSPGAP